MGEKETAEDKCKFCKAGQQFEKKDSKDSFSLGARLETQGRRKEKTLPWIGLGS